MNARLLIDSLWVLSTRVALRAANLVAFLLLARALSVEAFGFYGWATATATVLSVAFDLGLRQSTAYVTGRAPQLRAAAVTHMLGLALILGAAAAAAAWLALAAAGYDASYGGLSLLVAANTWAMLLLRTGQGAFLGGGQLARMNATELVPRVVLLGGTAALYLAGSLDLARSLWILLAAHVLACLWLLFQLRRDIEPSSLPDVPLIGELFARGLTFAGGILLLLLMGRAGIWIVGAELGEEALGLWFGVQRLGEMLVEVATAVGIVLFSHGVRATDPRSAAVDAVRTARLVSALMALISLVSCVVAPAFLTALLGPAYATQALPFRIVMLGTVAACFNAMLYPTLGAQGLARWGVLAYALGCSATVAMTLSLAPVSGLAGAATAYALSQALVTILLLVAYRRRFGFSAAWVLLPQRDDLDALRGALRRGRRGTGDGAVD